jgi:hypothetical protein
VYALPAGLGEQQPALDLAQSGLAPSVLAGEPREDRSIAAAQIAERELLK